MTGGNCRVLRYNSKLINWRNLLKGIFCFYKLVSFVVRILTCIIFFLSFSVWKNSVSSFKRIFGGFSVGIAAPCRLILNMNTLISWKKFLGAYIHMIPFCAMDAETWLGCKSSLRTGKGIGADCLTSKGSSESFMQLRTMSDGTELSSCRSDENAWNPACSCPATSLYAAAPGTWHLATSHARSGGRCQLANSCLSRSTRQRYSWLLVPSASHFHATFIITCQISDYRKLKRRRRHLRWGGCGNNNWQK